MFMREAMLQRLSKAYVAEEATSVLRHELRNRVGIVRNANFFLRKTVASSADAALRQDQRVAEFFDLIDQQLGEISKSLATTLIPAPGHDGREDTDVSAAVENLLSSVALPSTIGIEPKGLQSMRTTADAAELQLAMFCLLENAVEAMEERGAITVSARVLPDRRLAIDVDDHGSGLTEEQATRAFQPFHSTKPGHVGLGLNVARRIARRWGGNVEISGREGGGTRASLIVISPREQATVPERNNEQASSAARR